MPSSTTLTLRIRPETKDALDRVAAATDRTRSWLAAAAIEDYIERELAIIEGIGRGISDMEAGRVVSHDDAMDEIDAALERVAKRRS